MPPDEPGTFIQCASIAAYTQQGLATHAPLVADTPSSASTSPLPSAENSPEPLALWVHEHSGRCAFCDFHENTRTYIKPNGDKMHTWRWCHPECQEVAALLLRKSV